VTLLRHLKEASINLFAAKLRSLLALLGILVGTASVVAMVSGGQLAKNEALKQFKTLGTDLLAVSINNSPDMLGKASSETNITLEQVARLTALNKNIAEIAPYTQLFSPIKLDGHSISGGILGVTDSFARVMHIELAEGRFISSLDGYALFCVIGDKLFEQIKRNTWLDPVGQQLQVGNNYFTIIGVAKPWPENSFLYASVDHAVMIPIQASILMSQYAAINDVILQLSPHANIEQVQSNVADYINQQVTHKRLFFRSAKELVARMAKQSKILTIFLGLIGGISLLVGGIGVMNIMLVSVIERKREIGIRLAVGATRKNIQTLFLTEAMVLALVGGVLGVFVGIMISYFIALFSHWQFTFFALPPLIGFSVSAITGIFFGYYPAYKASQLDPIQALRME
jgi:putative ABC transport system permease protein